MNKDYKYILIIFILLSLIPISYIIGNWIGYYQGNIDGFLISKNIKNNYSNECFINNSDFSSITYETHKSFIEKEYYCKITLCIEDNYCKEEYIKLKLY